MPMYVSQPAWSESRSVGQQQERFNPLLQVKLSSFVDGAVVGVSMSHGACLRTSRDSSGGLSTIEGGWLLLLQQP